MSELAIPFSRKNIIKLMLGFAGFTLLGLLFMAIGGNFLFEPIESNIFKDMFLQISGGAISLFFGFNAYTFLILLFKPNPALILNTDGVTDNTGFLSAGYIPWTNVERVEALQNGINSHFKIRLKDPTDYLNKGNPFERLIKSWTMNKKDAYAAVFANRLDADYEEVLMAFNKYCL